MRPSTWAHERVRGLSLGLRGPRLPLAFVDRAALEWNVDLTATRAGSLPVRVASKSVREEIDPDGLSLNGHLRDVFEG